MSDKARAYTDKELEKIEKELERLYAQALADILRKWDAYIAQHAQKLERLLKRLKKALTSGDQAAIDKAKAEYEAELERITKRDNAFKQLKDDIIKKLVNTDKLAYDMVNAILPKIYAANYNDLSVPAGVAFGIIDPKTVKNLVLGTLNLLADERWNRERLNAAIMQGILLGENMNDIAKRLLPMLDGNRKAAMRNARTAVTYAENQGRLDSMKAADEDFGLVYEKMWIATHDNRTRDSHLEVDREQVPLNEEFSNGLMCPADPNGAPEEVFNCRCTMNRILVGIRRPDGSIMKVNMKHQIGGGR